MKLNYGKIKSNQIFIIYDDIYYFVKWSLINLEIKYQKIFLKYNHSHKVISKYNEKLLKQTQRKSQLIRENYKVQIIISWFLKSLFNKSNLSYINMIKDIHSHKLTSNFDVR